MLDPELMTDADCDDRGGGLLILSVLIVVFCCGFGLGYLVAWL
jgi:hypothetical protein